MKKLFKEIKDIIKIVLLLFYVKLINSIPKIFIPNILYDITIIISIIVFILIIYKILSMIFKIFNINLLDYIKLIFKIRIKFYIKK